MAKIIKHEHIIIRAEIDNPPYEHEYVSDWVEDLIKKIGMKLLRGPMSVRSDMPGNEGVTAIAIIETSHIAVHIWDKVKPALLQLDVYSCAELDENIVIEHLKEFKPKRIEYKFFDREFDIKER